jgi:hypothetical protein
MTEFKPDPLSDPETEARIRAKAQKIWEEEGCPPNRAAAHWEMARELVAIEDNQRLATKPNPVAGGAVVAVTDEPVEPEIALENQGEFPGMADQGEETPRAPSVRRAADAS